MKLRKTAAILLAAITVLLACPLQAQALTSELVFTNADSVAADNAAVSYDSCYGAVKITAAAAGEVKVSVSDISLTAGKTLVVTAKAAPTNSDSYSGLFCSEGGAQPIIEGTGYKFYAAAVPLTRTGVGVTFTFGAQAGDYILLDSLVCTDNAASDAEIRLEQANGTMNGFTEEELSSDCYDAMKYTQSLYEGNIVYNEPEFVMTDADGSLAPIELMYTPDKIVSVQNATLTKEYVYGVDYTVEDGKLVVLPSGSIKINRYNELYPAQSGSGANYVTLDGGYVKWAQSPMFYSGQIAITYTHSDTWEGVITPGKSCYINRTIEKLERGEDVHICYLGDSMTGGANSSSYRNAEPFAEWWNVMAVRRLQAMYPDANITFCIHSRGGAGADWAAEEAAVIYNQSEHERRGSDTDDDFASDAAYTHGTPDLLVLSFGANDCMNGDDSYKFKATIETAVSGIQSINSECDIILAASMICNNKCFPITRFTDYAKRLYEVEIAYENVAVADLTSVHKNFLYFKKYLDMTGDNMCHPNDFMARMFAQVITQTLRESSLPKYKEAMTSLIAYHLDLSEYRIEDQEQLRELIREGAEKIAACTDYKQAVSVVLETENKMDMIPTEKELLSSGVDYSRLVFDTETRTKLLAPSELFVSFSGEYGMAELKATDSTRDPNVKVDFTKSDKKINASDYTHAVVVYKNPSSNSALACDLSLEFYIGGSTPKDSYEYYVCSYPGYSDEFTYEIFDLTEEDWWYGEISGIRFDPFFRGKAGDVFYLDSIMLINGYEEAEAAAQERLDIINAGPVKPTQVYVFGNAEQIKPLSSGEYDYKVGDVNGDGSITPLDALVIRYNLAGAGRFVGPAGDINSDGEITPVDALLIRKMLAGLIQGETIRTGSQADITYDSGVKSAVTVTETGLAGTTELTYSVTGADIFAGDYRYAIITYRSDVETECTVAAGNTQLSTETFTADGIFHSFVVDMSALEDGTAVESLKLCFKLGGGNKMYINSISFAANETEAQKTVLIRDAAANA